MSQTESNNPLGSMISQLLSNPQQMQQLQQMAASLGLTAPNDNGAASACPQNESGNGTTSVSPNLSSSAFPKYARSARFGQPHGRHDSKSYAVVFPKQP